MEEINTEKQIIDDILLPINDYLISFEKSHINGFFQMKIGLPVDWEYQSTKLFKCTELSNNGNGKVILIEHISNDGKLDTIIEFARKIIETNLIIAEKVNEFKSEISKTYDLIKQKKDELEAEISKIKTNKLNEIFTDNNDVDETEKIKSKNGKNKQRKD